MLTTVYKKRFTPLGNSAVHPFADTGKNQITATLQERATQVSTLLSRYVRQEFTPFHFLFYGLKK